jgi:hypothetical protein
LVVKVERVWEVGGEIFICVGMSGTIDWSNSELDNRNLGPDVSQVGKEPPGREKYFKTDAVG